MKKLIETALPLSSINAKTISERTGASGHPANLHMWWGRSPKHSSLTALAAALVDACDDKEELLRRLKRMENGEYAEFGNKPTVFDPFSGFGGISLAAQKLGLPTVAGDLNPVAVMLSKAATEIPALFANRSPVNQFSLINDYVGTKGLAEDVQYYGEWLLEQAEKRLNSIYPNEPEGKPAAWIWARTVKCPNPACGCQMPLVSSFVLNGKPGQEAWAEPVEKDGTIQFEIHRSKCPEEKETNKYRNYGARFICPICGEITADEYVKQKGLKHELGTQLMAEVVDTPNGRIYKAPTEAQITAASVPLPENIPAGEIPDNAHWFSPPGFGMKDFADLFSPRQLTMLTTFCDLLLEVQNKAASDALAAGMSHEGGSLADGGSGALAYSQAISVYLAFVIDKMADRNTTVCSWNSSSGSPRSTFGRQAIPMVWNFAEINPFSTMTGNFTSTLKNVVAAIADLPTGSAVQVYQGDAVTEAFPEDTLVCTELPYYKAIGYAHLSDFFYIWMRRSLKSVFPDLFNQMVTSKNELSTVGQFYGEEQKTCEAQYEAKLRLVVEKLYHSATADYPALMFFEYHRADENIIHNGTEEISAWEKMLQAVVNAGFAVNAIWPMRSEPASDKADGIRVLIVARKQEKTEQTTRRAFINTLKREVPEKIDIAFCAGIDDCDKELVALGRGLAIFTRYKRVINADGSDTSIHDALQIIYQETKDLTNINSEEFSADAEIKED